jgi:hypothetical protein
MVTRALMVAVVCCNSAVLLSAQGKLAGRTVAVAIVHTEDLSPAPLPGAAPSLVSVRSVMTGDTTIYSLLQANGIFPDSEAFTLVYDLNPLLRDVKDVKEGTSVELPKISPESSLQAMAAAGNLARVSVDPDLRSRLSEMTRTLQALVSASEGVTSAKTQEELNTVVKWYAQIDKSYGRRTGPPLRAETLHELVDEAAALNSLLQTAGPAKRRLSAADEAQIDAIYDDLTKVMLSYGQALGNEAPKGEQGCDVVVSIKGSATEANASDAMRVYYTFNGLYRDPPTDPPVKSSEWMQLGSGHSARLLSDKTYKLWAARDGDPGHPLTAPFKLETSCTDKPATVELSVPPRSQ